ncbi:MAG: response regulator transcription factor [Ferruginibacter sp.]
MANIALTDDHILLRTGLAGLIKSLGHTVIFEADNGRDLIEKIEAGHDPDIIILDINMPVMDGYQTAEWLRQNRPAIKILALSMYSNEIAILRMLRHGARGYILKDCQPEELEQAITSLINKGYHYSEVVGLRIIDALNQLGHEGTDIKNAIDLTTREIDFLKLICTELTYKEIADKMMVSPRTIDGYREMMFEKLNLKTRVGLAVFAMKYGIAESN